MNPGPQRESGVVLLVSLILLLATTIVGYSVMETSNLESRMAATKLGKQQTFEAAESVISEVLDNQVLHAGARAADLSGGAWPTAAYPLAEHDGINGDAVVRYRGNSIAYGEDWTKGLKNEYFETDSRAERAGSPFASQHVQGFRVRAPSL